MRLDWLFEDKEKTKKLRMFTYVVIACLLIGDVFLHRGHTYFEIEMIPGLYAVIGAFSCWVIIFFSKWIGKVWLQVEEDYYDKK